MGRRDHLLRIALSANQSQIEEPATPGESESEDEEEIALVSKNEKIQRFDLAQAAILNAIGFSNDESRKKDLETQENELLTISSACQIVNYLLPLPLSCLRNQVLVLRFCPPLTPDHPYIRSVILIAFSIKSENSRTVPFLDRTSLNSRISTWILCQHALPPTSNRP